MFMIASCTGPALVSGTR